MGSKAGRWAAVPVSLQLDPLVLGLTPAAELFYIRSWLYSADHLTDGVVPQSAWPMLVMQLDDDPGRLTDEVVHAGLARRTTAGDIKLVGYVDWNPSSSQVKHKTDIGRKNALKRWARDKGPDSEDTDEPDGNDAGGLGSGHG